MQNHDGILDECEWHYCVRNVLRISTTDVTDDMVRAVFEVLDLDGSGGVEVAEVVRFAHDGK